MGIAYDVIAVFGVEYTPGELTNFFNHEEIKRLAEAIGCDHFSNLWSEFGQYSASPYFDANQEDQHYLFGYKLNCCITPTEMREILELENDLKKQVRAFSQKYAVDNKENEIKIMYFPNVW